MCTLERMGVYFAKALQEEAKVWSRGADDSAGRQGARDDRVRSREGESWAA